MQEIEGWFQTLKLSFQVLLTYLLTHSLTYSLMYLLTYLLTYLLHGAESFLRS